MTFYKVYKIYIYSPSHHHSSDNLHELFTKFHKQFTDLILAKNVPKS